MADELKCAGCGNVMPTGQLRRVDRDGVYLCRGRGVGGFSDACYAKALLHRAATCKGCGKDFPPYGDEGLRVRWEGLCDVCRKVLTDRRASGYRKYLVPTRPFEVVSQVAAVHDWEKQSVIRRALEALCGVVDSHAFRSVEAPVLVEPAAATSFDSPRMALIEVDEGHAAAIKLVLPALLAAVENAEQDGKEQGHSLLVRLARGESSVEDYETRVEREKLR